MMPLTQTLSIPDVLVGASATSGSLASLASTTIAQQPQFMPGQSAQAPTSIIQHGPLRRLPLELLDEIIVTALIDETANSAFFNWGMYAHRRLALVCPLWHEIVLALRRRPWTYSNIHMGKDCATSMVSDDVKSSMMREYLDFSGNEPLNVTLDLGLVSGGIPPYVRAVLEQSHRLQSLSITGDLRDEGAHSALSLISHPGDLPILRNLSLEDVGTAPIKEETDEVAFDFFEHALALTNLTLAGSLGTSLIDVYVLYDNITSFTCKDMDAEVLLDFLMLMPNLERLDFSGPSGLASPSWELCFDEPDDDVDTGCTCCHCIEEDEDIALELSYLKQLIIRDTAQAVSSELLDFLCFPAIEEVTLKRDEKFETEVMVALQGDIHDGGGDVERLVVNYV